MFPLKQEMFHDVALENHLKCLAGAPDALETIGVNTLLLVEHQAGFDPFRRRHHVCPAPTHGLQFLQNTERWDEKEVTLGPHGGFLQGDVVPTKV